MAATSLEGIVTFDAPSGGNAGHFNLPGDFDPKLHAANWVQVGPNVDKAKGVQPILGTNFGAVGWEVWKYPKGHKEAGKPHKVTLSKGEYMLMFRPKSVQENVNAIYGNVSKRHLVRTQTEAIPTAPGATGDEGVLSPARLEAAGVRDFGNDYEMNIPQNPVKTSPQVDGEPDSTGTLQT